MWREQIPDTSELKKKPDSLQAWVHIMQNK